MAPASPQASMAMLAGAAPARVAASGLEAAPRMAMP